MVNHSEKPQQLLTRLIKSHAHPSELILDLFSGSGSASVAALFAGCNVVAVEQDPHQINAINFCLLKCTEEAHQSDEEESEKEENVPKCCICNKGPAANLITCDNCGKLGHWKCNKMLNTPNYTSDDKENTFFDSMECFLAVTTS